jgi:hypothetical protein
VHYAAVIWVDWALPGTAIPAVVKAGVVFAVAVLASWLAVALLRQNAVPRRNRQADTTILGRAGARGIAIVRAARGRNTSPLKAQPSRLLYRHRIMRFFSRRRVFLYAGWYN